MDRALEGLASALGLEPGEMMAFVGAGGKTTAGWRLWTDLAAADEPVVFTTTTRIFKPAGKDIALILDPEPTLAQIERALGQAPGLVLAAALGESGDQKRAMESPYPAERVKLVGLTPDALDALSRELPGVTWLVEADGARGRLLKAPAAYEPVIPTSADRVAVVAGLDGVGEPLNDYVVHRPEVAAQLIETSRGARITPQMVADLLAHPQGGMKGIPPGAEVVVLLTRSDAVDLEDGGLIAERLLSRGRVARVVEADLRKHGPVEVWTR